MSYSFFLNQLNNRHYQHISQQQNHLLHLLNSNPFIGQVAVLSSEDRIKQIDDELDIIRGISPTPKGYVVDKTKVRSLLKERKNIN